MTSDRLHAPRAVVLLLALMSAVMLGHASKLSCAMHGLGGTSLVMEMTSSEGGSAAGTASHETHEHSGGQQEPRDDDEGCACTCIDDCSIGAPAAMLPTVTTLRVAALEAPPRRVAHAQTSLAPPRNADRRLPFANGPPATRLS